MSEPLTIEDEIEKCLEHLYADQQEWLRSALWELVEKVSSIMADGIVAQGERFTGTERHKAEKEADRLRDALLSALRMTK